MDAEFDSIHSGGVEYSEACSQSTVYVAYDYYERHAKFVGRHVTRIADVPMIDAILVLLFAPRAELVADSACTRYEAVVVTTHASAERRGKLYFSHMFSSAELARVNEIRRMISDVLCNRERLVEAQKFNLAEAVLRFIKMRRVLQPQKSRWDRLLFGDSGDGTENLAAYPGLAADQRKREGQIILAEIPALKIREDRRLWTEEGTRQLEILYRETATRKQRIVGEFDRRVHMYKQKEAYLACTQCRSYLFSVRSLAPVPRERDYFRLKNSFCFDPLKTVPSGSEARIHLGITLICRMTSSGTTANLRRAGACAKISTYSCCG